MPQKIKAFNNGFKNCIFITRENAARVIAERIEEHDVFPEKPIDIKMERVDDTHDRLSLTFSNSTLDGIVEWRRTAEGNHYVLAGYEEMRN